MDGPAHLFDHVALMRNRARAKAPALFLHDSTALEVQERLKEVNRTFTTPAVVAGHPGPWQQFGPVVPDTAHLALEPGGHDLIVHGLSLHWADDPVGQLVQCRQALRPDGLLIAALFGGSTLHELRAALAEAETRITGGLSPRVVPMGEIRDLGGLLQRAGFALPVADSASLTVTYESPLHLMRDLRDMGEANAMVARTRTPTRRAVLLEAAEIYQASYGRPDGRIAATFEVIYLTGWAPAQDQPQPLRPGSASARLADALGVPELDPERTR